MSGLLLKELMLLKGGWKSYAFLTAIYAIMALSGMISFFSAMVVLLLIIIPSSSFSADELARWDAYAVVMPGGRRAVVKSKYQYCLLTVGAVFALACLVSFLMILLNKAGDIRYGELVYDALIYALIGLAVNLVMMPLLFKYGAQKGRLIQGIIYCIVFAAFAIVVMILGMTGSTFFDAVGELFPSAAPVILPAALVVVAVLAVIVSYHISCRIYDKKEF